MKTSNKIFSFGFLTSILFAIGSLIFIKSNIVPTEQIMGEGKLISETRTVGKFDRLRTGGSFNIQLHYGEPSIKVEAYENIMDKIETKTENGSLYIGFQPGNYNNAFYNTVVHVTTKNLTQLEVGSAGSVMSSDTFKVDNIDLRVNGSGSIKFIVQANDVTANISSSGNLDLSGSATNLTAKTSGSGDFNALDLQVENADIIVSSAGTARINAKAITRASVSGSGDLIYKGTPTINDLNISSAGNISKYK